LVELESLRQQTSVAQVMRGRVFAVTSDDFVIGPPKVAGVNQPLVRNEALQLTISERGHLLCGRTHVIGRAKFTHDGETVYGYRLSLPPELTEPKPRASASTSAPKTRRFVVEAELRCLKRAIPVRGIVTALSEKMVHMRSMNTPADLRDGERLTFVAQLPAPLGAVERTVRVASVRPVGARGMTTIGLKFVAPMHEARPIRWGE